MSFEDIVSELMNRRDFSEVGLQKMIANSNQEISDVGGPFKATINLYNSIKGHDRSANLLYTSEEDRAENKAKIRKSKTELMSELKYANQGGS